MTYGQTEACEAKAEPLVDAAEKGRRQGCRKANSSYLETTDVGLWLSVALEVIVDQHYQIVRLQQEKEPKQ